MFSIDSLRALPGYLKPADLTACTPEEGRAWERRRRAMLTAMTSAAYRGLSLAFPILTIGLFLKGLGVEIYGLWMAVSSFFALFAFADLGLGSGLLTRLSQACGQDDQAAAKRLVASAFFMLAVIACVLLVAALASFPFIHWGSLLNAASAEGIHATPWIVWSVVVAQLLQIPFAIVYRTQLALQEGYKFNLWQSVGVALNLAVVLILVHCRVRPLLLITTTSLLPVIVMGFNWLYFFTRDNPALRPRIRNFDRSIAVSLLNTGSAFFLLAILTTLGLSLDNFLVSRTCGISEVAAFSVATRIASVLSLVVEMLSMPMWSAYGEALTRGDRAWVRRSCVKLSGLSGLLALSGGALLVVFGPWVLTHWLGKGLSIGRDLLLYCAVRSILLAFASPFFMVLNGAGVVRPQVYAFLAFTPASIILKILLARYMGSGGVALGMALLYGTCMLPWVFSRAMSVCKGTDPA